jgi:hypothetical protein
MGIFCLFLFDVGEDCIKVCDRISLNVLSKENNIVILSEEVQKSLPFKTNLLKELRHSVSV